MRVNEPVTQVEIDLPDDLLLVSKTDVGGRITFVNQAFVDVSGYTEEELIGAPHNVVRHPDMPPAAFADLWDTIKAGRPWEGLVKNRAKNGDHYWVRANATPIVEDGAITGYISVRTKPSRAEVAAAEALYADIREGRAGGVRLSDGVVLSTSATGRLTRFLRGFQGRMLVLGLVMTVFATIAASVGLTGLSASGDAVRTMQSAGIGPVVKLARLQAVVEDSGRRAFALRDRPGDAATVQAIKANMAEADRIWADVAPDLVSVEEAELAKRLAAMRKGLDEMGFQPLLALADPAQAGQVVTEAVVPGVGEAASLVAQLIATRQKAAAAIAGDESGRFSSHLIGTLLALAATLLVFLVAGRSVFRSVRDPLARMEEQFLTISKGNLLAAIPTESMPDFARANAMLRTMRAHLAFGAEERRENMAQAQESLRSEMLTLTEVLEGEVQETVTDISTQAARLSEGAARLTRVADELMASARSVTESVETTAGNVQTVASATEELEASSREISSQVSKSSQLAETARERVDLASERVAGLTEASARIGNVVGMIQNIAGQTRMLALNATIEAARAGEAGKGFAVVAEEVKGLANQTEEGISTVSTQAEDIGRTTGETVETVGAVAQTIREIDSIAAEVARAADEQRAATAEIMSSAVQAADHTRMVAERVQSMMSGVEATGSTAQRVTNLSAMVNHDIEALQRRLHVILRSSYGGDRRHEGRVPVAIRYHAEFEGRVFEGYTGDLSQHGALLVIAGANMPNVSTGIVDLHGVGKLEARMLSESVVGLHVRFDNLGRKEKDALQRRIDEVKAHDQPFIDLVQKTAFKVTEALDKALRDGAISETDLFDIEYDAIPGTDPLQVMAKHTELAERLFPGITEGVLSVDPRIVLCCATDRSGYIAAHNAKYSQPQRPGDPVWNAANARNRRVFDDRTGILAARNTKPFLAQTYARDMGGGQYILLKEIDAPVHLRQRHWGAVRMAMKLEST